MVTAGRRPAGVRALFLIDGTALMRIRKSHKRRSDAAGDTIASQSDGNRQRLTDMTISFAVFVGNFTEQKMVVYAEDNSMGIDAAACYSLYF
jgi:hypothetical protein